LRAGKTTSGLSTISAQNGKNATVMLPPVAAQAAYVRDAEAVASIFRPKAQSLESANPTFAALLAAAFLAHEVE